MEPDEVIEEMKNAVAECDVERTEELARKAVDMNIDALDVVEKGLSEGIRIVGERFGSGEYFLPDLVMGAEAMKEGLKVLEPLLAESKDERAGQKKKVRILIGTVVEDIHDIGKNIVVAMLMANGFEVIDLGVDVKTPEFVEKVKETSPDVLGLSALLSVTIPRQKDVIEALEAAGIRDDVKVIVGGSGVTQEWAESIGADFYAEDAEDAVKKLSQLMRG